jgi:selenide,water dikinase
VEIDWGAVPLLPEALDLAAAGVVPGGTRKNLEHADGFTDFGDAPEANRLILADAQTSGGLLLAVPEARVEHLVDALRHEQTPAAAVIGRFTEEAPGRVRVHGT